MHSDKGRRYAPRGYKYAERNLAEVYERYESNSYKLRLASRSESLNPANDLLYNLTHLYLIAHGNNPKRRTAQGLNRNTAASSIRSRANKHQVTKEVASGCSKWVSLMIWIIGSPDARLMRNTKQAPASSQTEEAERRKFSLKENKFLRHSTEDIQ